MRKSVWIECSQQKEIDRERKRGGEGEWEGMRADFARCVYFVPLKVNHLHRRRCDGFYMFDTNTHRGKYTLRWQLIGMMSVSPIDRNGWLNATRWILFHILVCTLNSNEHGKCVVWKLFAIGNAMNGKSMAGKYVSDSKIFLSLRDWIFPQNQRHINVYLQSIGRFISMMMYA